MKPCDNACDVFFSKEFSRDLFLRKPSLVKGAGFALQFDEPFMLSGKGFGATFDHPTVGAEERSEEHTSELQSPT